MDSIDAADGTREAQKIVRKLSKADCVIVVRIWRVRPALKLALSPEFGETVMEV